MVAEVISLRRGVPLLVRKTISLRARRMSSRTGRPERSGGSGAKGVEGPAGSPWRRQLRRRCGVDEALPPPLQLDDAELRVAANLLLHARDGDWMPQAARLRMEYEPQGHRRY